MARNERIEVIMTVGHREASDVGAKEASSPDGALQGFPLRGSDNVAYHIADVMWDIGAGFQGFLVYHDAVDLLLAQRPARCCGTRAGTVPRTR